MDYADGTTITGNFSLHLANEVSGYETSEFLNPYKDGEPNGFTFWHCQICLLLQQHTCIHTYIHSMHTQHQWLSVHSAWFDFAGLVEIHFPDGGYYKGNMTDGTITGQGDYQSAFNEVGLPFVCRLVCMHNSAYVHFPCKRFCPVTSTTDC